MPRNANASLPTKFLEVTDGVCGCVGCSELFFIEPGIKVDGRYYWDVLLKQQMLPVMRRIAGPTYVFQQDSAPAHHARETVQLLQMETPEFIASDLWPPNSPDLNPVDYKVWGLMQERVTKLQYTTQLI